VIIIAHTLLKTVEVRQRVPRESLVTVVQISVSFRYHPSFSIFMAIHIERFPSFCTSLVATYFVGTVSHTHPSGVDVTLCRPRCMDVAITAAVESTY
jgi:hypothetical protein